MGSFAPVSRRLSTMLSEARSRGPSSNTIGHAAPLPVKELRAGRLAFALVDLRADVLGDALRRLPARSRVRRPCDRWARAPVLTGASFGRQHQAFVVGMAHDEAADQARADAPTGLPDVIELAFLGLELHVEGFAEILAEVVAGAGLQRQAVLHHGFDAIAPQRAGELLGVRLHAFDHRHGHDVFGDVGVDVQHAQHFFERFS